MKNPRADGRGSPSERGQGVGEATRERSEVIEKSVCRRRHADPEVDRDQNKKDRPQHLIHGHRDPLFNQGEAQDGYADGAEDENGRNDACHGDFQASEWRYAFQKHKNCNKKMDVCPCSLAK